MERRTPVAPVLTRLLGELAYRVYALHAQRWHILVEGGPVGGYSVTLTSWAREGGEAQIEKFSVAPVAPPDD